ncbi:hypothetical protein [Lactobacillus gasseri]|uniref:hypothetical protein n=1 Tax=Lactobacillus gasseri TaxID=1596 RepID=UPI0022E3E0CF|nr:hypothetical protein [Lactobacillus gasseri]
MNFKKQLFFGAIALLTVGLTGCANNTSSNSSNNQATSSKSSKTNQSSSHELTITDIVGTYVNKDKTAAVVLQNGHTLWYYQTRTIMMVQKMILVIGITKVTINSQLR